MRKIIIESKPTFKYIFKELWEYRGLFYHMALRDILVRYKQTVIGIAWSVLRPLLTMIIFVIVFDKIAGLSSGNTPYPIFVYIGIIPWHFFSNTLAESGNSLINEANMVSKIYFPRIIIPSSAVAVNLIDLLISFVILSGLMLFYGFSPGRNILFLPALMIFAALPSLGAGYWIAALNVKYRDFRYIISFIVQLGVYISPVGFGSDVIPEKWRMAYAINPMAGVIDGFRWAFLGNEFDLYIPGFILSLCVAVACFISGVCFFYKNERKIADII